MNKAPKFKHTKSFKMNQALQKGIGHTLDTIIEKMLKFNEFKKVFANFKGTFEEGKTKLAIQCECNQATYLIAIDPLAELPLFIGGADKSVVNQLSTLVTSLLVDQGVHTKEIQK